MCTVNRRGAGPRNSAVANSPPGSSLTRLEERTAPPADLKVTVDTWPTWEGAVGSRLSMYHVQLECMENRAQNQGGRSHDPGLTRGRGGPFRASKVMTRVDARPSRVAAVRERGDITRRSASPVSGQTCSEHPGSAQRAYRAAVWCSRHEWLCWLSQKRADTQPCIQRLKARETEVIPLVKRPPVALEIDGRDLTNGGNTDTTLKIAQGYFHSRWCAAGT